MKKLVVLFMVITSLNANANFDSDDIFAGFIGFILGQIVKDHAGHVVVNNKVILKDLGDRIVLGRVVLRSKWTSDSVSLPACKVSKNDIIGKLRFKVSNENAYVDQVQITYQDNSWENVRVKDTFSKESASRAFDVRGNQRCIKQIKVYGHSQSNKFLVEDTVLTFVGLKQNASGF